MAVTPVEISVIVPVMNEAENIPVLAGEIEQALGALGRSWECVWVNDGSTDGSAEALDRLAAASRVHRAVHLDGNFGQSAALATGFGVARGAIYCTLDGDGQNDPADLPALVRALETQGVDVMNGVRAKRQDSWVRKLSSRIGNGFRNAVTREQVRDVGCSIRAFRRECAEGLVVFRGLHRYLPTLFRLRGFRIAEMPVNHRPRVRGKTKYGISNRLWVGLGDTLAVRWMQSRLVWPRVKRVTPAGESAADGRGA
jgi:glycosyltransferase involved in cell wall biosynthesis